MRKPLPYAALLTQVKERLEAAKKRLEAKPDDLLLKENVQWLQNDVTRIEWYAAQEQKAMPANGGGDVYHK